MVECKLRSATNRDALDGTAIFFIHSPLEVTSWTQSLHERFGCFACAEVGSDATAGIGIAKPPGLGKTTSLRGDMALGSRQDRSGIGHEVLSCFMNVRPLGAPEPSTGGGTRQSGCTILVQ